MSGADGEQCWINEKYGIERLWLHYVWIFVCMFGTILIYATTYITLRSRVHSWTQNYNSNITPLSANGNDLGRLRRAGTYMIFYPVIYTVCTLPLAAGRMAAMTGVEVSYLYYCLTGAAITCESSDIVSANSADQSQ